MRLCRGHGTRPGMREGRPSLRLCGWEPRPALGPAPRGSLGASASGSCPCRAPQGWGSLASLVQSWAASPSCPGLAPRAPAFCRGVVADGLCRAQISRCLSIPCFVSSSDECLWTDWAMEKNNVDGRQAKHYACIKRSDGSCAWYRGMAPPKQEFLDIEDP